MGFSDYVSDLPMLEHGGWPTQPGQYPRRQALQITGHIAAHGVRYMQRTQTARCTVLATTRTSPPLFGSGVGQRVTYSAYSFDGGLSLARKPLVKGVLNVGAIPGFSFRHIYCM